MDRAGNTIRGSAVDYPLYGFLAAYHGLERTASAGSLRSCRLLGGSCSCFSLNEEGSSISWTHIPLHSTHTEGEEDMQIAIVSSQRQEMVRRIVLLGTPIALIILELGHPLLDHMN